MSVTKLGRSSVTPTTKSRSSARAAACTSAAVAATVAFGRRASTSMYSCTGHATAPGVSPRTNTAWYLRERGVRVS